MNVAAPLTSTPLPILKVLTGVLLPKRFAVPVLPCSRLFTHSQLSDAQAHKWTAEECRFKWMNDRHPKVNHKEWNNEEIDKLKRILAENKDGPRDWVEIAEELGVRDF